jgi:hypothetical protein
MATSNDLTTLDFATIKQNLKTYLSGQDLFQDYDFEGSNINVLLDILAYNTQLNAYYLNMISNEMFLDSALKRDSIVSHAKELNYLPRSFRSSVATINIYLQDGQADTSTIIIPRGTTFTGFSGNKNFTFSIPDNITARSLDNAGNFLAQNVLIYEGDYVSDTFVTNDLNPVRYKLTNKAVDTNSIRVTVIEDNGQTTLSYDFRGSLFDIDSQDQVYFLQAAENDTYEILFGDGIIGRKPKNNSIVIIDYRACNGELSNNIRKFKPNDDVGTATVTRIDTVGNPAYSSGGSIPESVESIKFNAPRAFTTQERVVTAQDYATILKANFSEINDVNAYGGEEDDPPQFGKVIIAVDLKNTDDLPISYRDTYKAFVKRRSPLSIDPVLIKPQYTYLTVISNVLFNINDTPLGVSDIESLVLSAIQIFSNENLNGFNKTLRYSKLIAAIDEAQDSIVSNDTNVFATKFLPIFDGQRQNYILDFGFPLTTNIGQKLGSHSSEQISTVTSSTFFYQGTECVIEDDGLGVLNIVDVGTEPGVHQILTKIGTVEYGAGRLVLEGAALSDATGGFIKFTARSASKDITASKRTILRVLDSDIQVNAQAITVNN